MKKKSTTYLCFRLADELYAVNVMNVLEVIDTKKVTVIPEMPTYISGIIDFRGDIITVTDLRKRFAIESEYDKDKYVITVLEIKQGDLEIKMGAIADKVEDVIEIKEADIKQISHLDNTLKNKYIAGMIKQDDNFIIILDINKIFTEKEIELFNSIAESEKGNGE